MRQLIFKVVGSLKTLNRRLSITKRIILLYVFLVLVPASVLMYFYYQRTSRMVEQEISNSILQAVNQVEINISYRLNNIKNISNSIFMNKRLRDYLSNEDNSIRQQIQDTEELRNIVESAQANTDVFRVRLFVDSSKIYSGEKINFFSMNDIKKKDWHKNIIEEDGRVYWKSTYTEHFIDSGDVDIISCARMLRSPKNYSWALSILTIDIQEKFLYNILSGIKLTHNESIFIIDSNGYAISHYDKTKLGSKIFDDNTMKTLNDSSEGIFSRGVGDKRNIVIHKTIERTGWIIAVSVPIQEITGKNNTLNKISSVIIIIATFILFVLAVFIIVALLAESMTRRVKQLVSIMKKEGIKNLDESINAKEGDLSTLEKSVDGMLQTVHSLMEEAYQSKMHEREAQLKALQAQINPHFLYNTLDMINWMAIRINAEDISYMIDSLAKYFRLSLNKGRDIVSIADEMNLARVYLEIQKKRFDNSFEVEISVDEQVADCGIPKLVLQPIVENALLHGIQKKKERRGRIRLEAKKYDDNIILSVSDDGIGMDNDTLKRIFSPDNIDSGAYTKASGYGLYNVNERIKLFSGEGSGISIYSEKGMGTRVEICLKAVLYK